MDSDAKAWQKERYDDMRGYGVPLRGGWAAGLLLALVLSAGSTGAAPRSLLIDDFEHGIRAGWEEKSFKGETVYRVVPDPETKGHCLQAEARGTASGLIFRREYDLRDYPVLSWRWRVAGTVAGGDETRKSGDDYAARVYVIFPHWFFPKTRSINYIWANRLPQGEHLPNPFSANAVMLAVESGNANAGRWMAERRNVYEDYRRLFGEEPPQVGAIAVMTDTDNTGGSAMACYDDIRIEGE